MLTQSETSWRLRNHRLITDRSRGKLFTALLLLLSTLTLSACNQPRSQLDQGITDLSLKTLSGEDFRIGQTARPLLVNFWSTSCVTCVAEMPQLVRLYEDYNPRGLRLVAVAMPYDPPNHVLEMAKAKKLPFPVALDLRGEAVAAFGGVQGTPISFLIDGQGRLAQRYVGSIPFEELRRVLDQLPGVG